nr:MAG TPA: hypothetical protein [Bacteriophage sp.]
MHRERERQRLQIPFRVHLKFLINRLLMTCLLTIRINGINKNREQEI